MRLYKFLNESKEYPPCGTLVQIQEKFKYEYYLKTYSDKWIQVKAEISPRTITIIKFIKNYITQDQLKNYEPEIIFEGGDGKEIKGLPDLYALPVGSIINVSSSEFNSRYKKIDEDTWENQDTNKKIQTVIFDSSISDRTINVNIDKLGRT